MYLPVTEIQRFSTHDGDGIRTVVFLKGCPLRCEWCHNPETQNTYNELFYIESNCILCGICENSCPNHCHHISTVQHIFDRSKCNACLACAQRCPANALSSVGKKMTIKEIVDEVMKDIAFYRDNGGVTLSGGEPLMFPLECIELLARLKANGINTAIETCGLFDSRYAKDIARVTDTFLFDFKDSNRNRHFKYTGVSNDKILENLYFLDSFGKNIVLRCIMLNKINMDDDHINQIARTFHELKNCVRVDLLPYHPFGSSKYKRLGLQPKHNHELIPDRQDLIRIKEYLINKGVSVCLN